MNSKNVVIEKISKKMGKDQLLDKGIIEEYSIKKIREILIEELKKLLPNEMNIGIVCPHFAPCYAF